MARLHKWAEGAIKVIDEKGDGTARIRLVTADVATRSVEFERVS